MPLKFTETDVPANVRREAEPNPFDGVFPRDDKAIKLTVDGPKDHKNVRKLVTQARKAGLAVDRTTRVKVTQTGTGKNTKTELVFWTVKRITRKSTETTDESTTESTND